MTIKKMLLLFSAMAALVAFAAPAAAQAEGDYWYLNETKVGGEEESTPLEGTGLLASTNATGFTSGPCEVHASGALWNGETMGEGIVTAATITASHAEPCNTNGPPPCKLATVTANNLPWSVTLTPGGGVDIAGVSYTKRYTGCGALGIPDGFPVTVGPGTLTGQMEGDTIVSINAGHLELAPPLAGKVVLNGSATLPGITAGP